MNEKYLFGILYQTFRVPLRKINSLYDYYSTIDYFDITGIKLDIIEGEKKEIDWALEHPEYDFNSILETNYTNEELYKWFKIYHEHILFMITKYNEGIFKIKADDLKDEVALSKIKSLDNLEKTLEQTTNFLTKSINKSPLEIKRYCLDVIKRRVTNEILFKKDQSFLRIFDLDTPNNSISISFREIKEKELVIIESYTKTGNWFIITTERLIVSYLNNISIKYFYELEDFTDETLENVDIAEDYINLRLTSENKDDVEFESLAGIPCMVVLNCVQRLLKLYSK